MTHHERRHRLIGTVVAAVVWLTLLWAMLALAPTALGQEGLAIRQWTIDAGGASSLKGGALEVRGTFGQPDAATAAGGRYEVRGGFWPGVGGVGGRVYMPVCSTGREP